MKGKNEPEVTVYTKPNSTHNYQEMMEQAYVERFNTTRDDDGTPHRKL